MVLGDGLPSQVCCDCANKLESAYDLKLQVERADNALRERIDKWTIKEELFFNEVEVDLDSERHDENISINDADGQTIHVNKSTLLKDELALQQVEKLSKQKQRELDDCHDRIKGHLDETEGEFIDDNDDESGDNGCKIENLTIGEHDYMVQQRYTLTNNDHEELLDQDDDHNSTDYTIIMDDNEMNDDENKEINENHDTQIVESEKPRVLNTEKNKNELSDDRNNLNDSVDTTDEANYFENLSLSCRLKRANADKSIDDKKIYFMCFVCDRQFLSKEVLKNHMNSHNEVKKSLATKKKIPEKSIKTPVISSPIKNSSSGKKLNKCPYCSKEYLYVISFNKHLKQHEGNEDDMKPTTGIHKLNDNNQEIIDSDNDFDNADDTFEVITDEIGNEDDDDENSGYDKTLEINQRFVNVEVKKNLTESTIDCDKNLSGSDLNKHIINNEVSSDLKYKKNEQHLDTIEDNSAKNQSSFDHEGVSIEQDLRKELNNICATIKQFDQDDEQLEDLLQNDDIKKSEKQETIIEPRSRITRYRCKICLQEFTNKDNLHNHAKQHINSKNTSSSSSYKCTECNKTFGNELTLRNHLIATNHRTMIQGHEYDPNKRIKRVAAKAAQKIIDKIKTEDNVDDNENDNNDKPSGIRESSGNCSAENLLLAMKNKTYKFGNNKRALECESCGKKCSSKQYLMKHMEYHVKEEKAKQEKENKRIKKINEIKKEKINKKNNWNSLNMQNDMRDINTDEDDDDFDNSMDWPMDNHECTACKKRYSTKKSLLRHQLLHEEPNFECDICNVKFYRKDKLKAHYDKCSEKNPDQVRKCNICGDIFENHEILLEHRSKHVDEGILTEEDLRELEPTPEERKSGEKIARKRRTDIVGLECTECNKQYTSRKGLLRHIQVHEGKKYLCDICPKKFYRREHLKIHVAKHNMIKPYKCTRCSKRFIKEEQLTLHLTKHDRTCKNKTKETETNSKRFLCEICSKSFTQSTTLVAHLRAHNGIKPFVCEVCARPFTTNAYLKMHMRTHTQERPYICQYCSRAFARADTLANHLTSHTGEAKYHCKFCPKKFRRLKSLKEHVFIHTGQRPYACPTCDRRFNNNGSRYAHSKRCKQTFTQNDSVLEQHQTNIIEIQGHEIQGHEIQHDDIQLQQQVHIQLQQEPHPTHMHCSVGNTMQVIQSKGIKTITLRPDQVSIQHDSNMSLPYLPLTILPLTVTLTDDDEVILPEGAKLFTTTQ